MGTQDKYYAAQTSSNSSVTISASSGIVTSARTGSLVRQQLLIVNTSAAAVVTITKGDVAAISGSGIILQPNGAYIESTDGGFVCWQGAVQGIGTGAGSVSVVETFISPAD